MFKKILLVTPFRWSKCRKMFIFPCPTNMASRTDQNVEITSFIYSFVHSFVHSFIHSYSFNESW